ncbi:hypothetical protein SAMN04489726_4280 [Allokutzneria albata]|uniref:Uncharacterized protein n=2 Tax=Allokutzneria albata TaxID=211114 RepID=A0A1G9XLE1_ALLAB|nr:hypothetical protein SAMN04489726_4280 [Allokutzneria albata]
MSTFAGMAISLDYQGDVRAGDCTFAVRARIGEAEHVAIELTGTDSDGDSIAAGELVLPADGLAPCGQLLSEVMEALSRLHDPRRNRKRGARTAANANAPWTPELDGQLREHWLARGADPTAGAAVIGELSDRFGRSRSSIRARLVKVGCDPDVPGRRLSSVDGDAGA